MDLKSILGNIMQNKMSQVIADKTGLSTAQVNSAIAVGLPMILAGMAKNASASDGAESLNKALDQHVDSGVTDDPAHLAAAEVESDGSKILSHVFGPNSGDIMDAIASKIGTDKQSIQRLMIILAPIAMAYLARQKKQDNLDADGVSDTLNKTKTPEGGSLTDLIGNVLDMVKESTGSQKSM